MNERLLLRLPHRQVVFTFPKVLRVFFRHDHGLVGDLSSLVYRMMQGVYSAAAGNASAGDFVRWNPHLHGIFLEGGFDPQGRFVHVPAVDLPRLAQYFPASVIGFFLRRSLINERLAKSMLGWTHSGFSLNMSVKIPRPAAGRSPAGGPARCSRTREALAQYIARPPVSLSKMLVEKREGSVLYRSEYNPYFKTDCRLFPARECLVQLLQHLPDPRTHLVRRYGLYSSRSRGTWSRKP
jgi:hypothetical protein